MGGDFFETSAWGRTAEEAFKKAVRQAEYDYGHAGYTGTIAEKTDFTMIPLPEHKDPFDLAHEMESENDERITDKWGPAGCIEIPPELEAEGLKKSYLNTKKKEGEKLFLFFGWASS